MSTTLCPQPAAASLARGAMAAKWGAQQGSWGLRGKLPRAGQCRLAWLPCCWVLGLAAILQLWLREGAGRGCAGVRGCAQAGGIISSYYSTSQSKCFLKASIH